MPQPSEIPLPIVCSLAHAQHQPLLFPPPPPDVPSRVELHLMYKVSLYVSLLTPQPH
jgi:hypothetical protein